MNGLYFVLRNAEYMQPSSDGGKKEVEAAATRSRDRKAELTGARIATDVYEERVGR